MTEATPQEFDPLYTRELLRLAADSQGAGHLSNADAQASAHNPKCGDRITIQLRLGADGSIQEFAHETHACVITQASACLLAQKALGQDRVQIASLYGRVRSMLNGAFSEHTGYEVFQSLCQYVGRHTCVLLPFQAAMSALDSSKPGGKGTEG